MRKTVPPCVPITSFFFNDTATTAIYTLSLHDALPIFHFPLIEPNVRYLRIRLSDRHSCFRDRKSTRLNSSHLGISYAVFCLKKKKTDTTSSQITTSYSKPSTLSATRDKRTPTCSVPTA